MLEKELLNPFYWELLELIGEEAMLEIYRSYQGLSLTVPKKLYDGKKIGEKFKNGNPADRKTRQLLARKYNYSQRQIDRFLTK